MRLRLSNLSRHPSAYKATTMPLATSLQGSLEHYFVCAYENVGTHQARKGERIG